MRRWLLILVACSACSHSPLTPAPSTVTWTGTVTATNGGQPLASAVIDVAGQHVLTDAVGNYRLEVPAGRYTLMISGAGLVPHTLPIDHGGALQAITESNGFDLGFYRELVRNGFEAPTTLEPLRRWTTAPSFDVQTVDETGAPIDPVLVAAVRAAIAAIVPIWTAGQFQASFGGGVPVRWLTVLDGLCGRGSVGPGGAGIELHYRERTCNIVQTAKHETGHTMGFWHTDNPADVMFKGSAAVRDPSARERAHAAIAYQRPVGNTDPDSD